MTICFMPRLHAQCSEAENADMKKYKQLTLTQDAQGCSQCAWLANLLCIAENGLYANDKEGIATAISGTKQNIKLMGDPICCPELLTKPIQWGTPKSAGDANETVTQTESEKQFDEIMEVATELNSMLDNALQSKDIGKEFDARMKVMNANKVLADKDPSTGKIVDYSSEEKIHQQYQKQKAEMEKHTPRLYELHQTMMNLNDQNVDISNSLNSTSMGLFEKLISSADAAGSASAMKKEIESMMQSLENSKQKQLFELKKTNMKADVIVSNETLEELMSQQKGKNDIQKFQANTILNGWNPHIKYGAFKKLFDKFKAKEVNSMGFFYRVGDSDIYFSTDKNFEVVALGKTTVEHGQFDAGNITQYQEKAMEVVREYTDKMGIEIYDYWLDIKNPFEFTITIVWTDYTTKYSSLAIVVKPLNQNNLIFQSLILDHSLESKYFKHLIGPHQDMVDEILSKKQGK
jgi:hypothetical protein